MGEVPVQIRIEPGTEKDIPVILRMIRSLADYEELTREVTATEEDLRASLFGASPSAEVILAYAGPEPIGFAVYFSSYSTFLGRPGIYLEDLFVLPEWRNLGCGKKLLAHVADIAVQRGCGRMEWSVLDWNEPAIRFYRRLGAKALDRWQTYRLASDALRELGAGGKK